MKNNIDVTISLVHYKTPELLLECIKSIYKTTKKVTFEIIVADNNSEDEGTALVKKYFRDVKVIENKKNLYATGANNQVFRIARGKYFMVLNPDMEFFDDVIFKMVDFLEKHSKIAAVSCLQYRKDKKTELTCSEFSTPVIEFLETNMLGRFFNEKKLLNYRYSGWDRKTDRIVDVIPDTIMLIRYDVAKKLQLYDVNIKLFFMENDLCMRINNLGYSVCHLGNVKVLHHRGESTRKFSSKNLYKIYEEDMLYYYKKYFGFKWKIFLLVTFQANRTFYLFEPLINYIKKK